jgi:hypothetical protein
MVTVTSGYFEQLFVSVIYPVQNLPYIEHPPFGIIGPQVLYWVN